MKAIKIIIVAHILIGFVLTTSSCVVIQKDNGRHKGWYKNTKNPHNPISTNPGRGHGKGKGK